MFSNLLSSRWFQAGLAFFVLCVGSSLLYSWHVQRTTEADLAKRPQPVVSIENKPETNTAPVDFQTEGVVNTPDETTDTPMPEGTEALKNNTDDLTDAFLPGDFVSETEETLEALPSAVQLPPGLVHWREWDGEKIVLDRDALIEEFGDTPEVHHYIELSRKIHTADSYTAREIYEHIVLEKQFTQNPNILPSHIEYLRQHAAENPDAVIRSWKSMINDPKARIFIQGREWQK